MPDPSDGLAPAAVPSGLFEADWRLRRRVVFSTLAFCAGGIVYLMLRGDPDSRLHETIANGLVLTAASVVLGYLGFPVLDDRFRRQAALRVWRTRDQASLGRTIDDPDAVG